MIISALLVACVAASGQQTPEQLRDRYNSQVRMVGADGVGVETILDKWEAAAPEDGDMLAGRFQYYLAKSARSEVVPKKQARFLGNKPVLTLKDTTGTDVNYFEETFFADSLLALAMKAIDKAVKLYPEELSYRFMKINALLSVEKESPDLALMEVENLISAQASSSPAWTFNHEGIDEGTFKDAIQEYCYSFYRVGTPCAYEGFLTISERMSKLYPKTSAFLTNIGTYWLVARENDKKAQSFYKKALKIDPEDAAALRNMKVIQARAAKAKAKK